MQIKKNLSFLLLAAVLVMPKYSFAADSSSQSGAADPATLEKEALDRLQQNQDAARADVRQAAESYQKHLSEYDPAYIRGKADFEAGRYADAAKEFEALAAGQPDLSVPLKRIAEVMNRLAEQDIVTNKAMAQIQKVESTLKPPAEFASYLDKLSAEMDDKARALQAQGHDSQKIIEAQEREITADFERGRALYESGKAEEAFQVWRAIAPRLQNRAEIEEAVRVLEEGTRRSAAASGGPGAEIAANALRQRSETSAMIRDAFAELTAKASDARQQQTSSAAELEARQKTADDAFRRGKHDFEMSAYDEALSEFEQVLPQLEDPSALARLIEIIKQIRSEENAAKQAAQRLDRTALQLHVPGTLTDTVRDAETRLRTRVAELEEDRSRFDKAFGEKRALIEETIAKGDQLFRLGDYSGALKVWRGLEPHLDHDAAFSGSLDSLQRAYDRLLQVQNQPAAQLAVPPEFDGLIKDAESKLHDEAARAQAQEAQMHESIAVRGQRVGSAIERARSFYAAENYTNARAEIESILPELEDRTRATHLVEILKIMEEQHAKGAADMARLREESQQVGYSPELNALIDDASAKIDFSRKEIENHRLEAQMIRNERTIFFNNGIAEGKRLSDRGDYAEALRVWRSLVPYMKDPQEVEPLLARAEAAAARRAETAAQIESDKASMFRTPAELPALMQQVGSTIESQASQDEAQKQQILQSLEGRRQRIYEAYQRAKDLSGSNKPEEAAKELEAVLPELSDPAQATRLIELLRQLADQREKSRIAIEHIRAQSAKLESPPELMTMLRDTDVQIRASMMEVENEKARDQITFSERTRFVNWLFEYGKKLFEQGDYAQAIKTWDDLVPYLENGPLVAGLVQNLKDAHQRYLQTRASAGESHAELAKVPAMPELEQTLGDYAKRFEKNDLPERPKTAAVSRSAADDVRMAGTDTDRSLEENDRMMREFLAKKRAN